MAASALLSPARPLAGTTLSFGVPYQNKRRIPTMRVYCAADEEEEVNDLGVNVALSMLKFYKTIIGLAPLPFDINYISIACSPLCEQEKYRPYYPQAAVMCQLAASTLCKHTKNTALQRVVMVMIPQGGLVRKSYQSNDGLDSIAYCLPMQLSQARVFRSSTAPDKGNLFVYSSIDSCHVEKLMALTRKNKQAMLQLEQSKGYIRHCRGNADSENWTCATHVEWAKRMRLFQP
uniref:Uncharacterized protein n=1 Tax=Oryza glumipatula TaxID=40148 RepID=A0A0E0BMG6_9ORYZ